MSKTIKRRGRTTCSLDLREEYLIEADAEDDDEKAPSKEFLST